MSTQWLPSGLLSGHAANPYAVLILNQPVNKNALSAVLSNASMLVCADAGADRLYKYDHDQNEHLNTRLPDAIVGDLDSLSDHVATYYRNHNVQIVKDPDQYSTDFTKCLKWMRERQNSFVVDKELDVVVLGGLGGRVDQGFSQIHHLYLASDNVELLSGRIYLLSEQSLTFILSEGTNIISIEAGYFEENVGIIPVLGPARLTTKGLEWDVQNWPTEFGGQLSTSNHIRSTQIEISFSGPRPLFTMELAARFAAAHPR
jgi:thiamine pyrophosphokinase